MGYLVTMVMNAQEETRAGMDRVLENLSDVTLIVNHVMVKTALYILVMVLLKIDANAT